jgi:hypothetical protein
MEKSSTENTKLFYKVLKNEERKRVPTKMHKKGGNILTKGN